MTQRDRILHELREAAAAGVRSDTFFALHLPRAAARIKELRDAGYDIRSEREGKYVRYRLHPPPFKPVENGIRDWRAKHPESVGVTADRPVRVSAVRDGTGRADALSPTPGGVVSGDSGALSPECHDDSERTMPGAPPTDSSLSPGSGEGARLFSLDEARERPLSAFRDSEAA